MEKNMYAFISYQTCDKSIAAEVKKILFSMDIKAFLAHEDICVSEEWRLVILQEISKANLFISLWSKNYLESHWCIQESGIAAFRQDMTSIPLSIDGTHPEGFANNIQAIRIKSNNIRRNELLPWYC